MIAIGVEQGIGAIKKDRTEQSNDQKPDNRQKKSNGGKIPLSPLQHVLFHNNPPGKLMYYKFSTLFSAGKGETCKIYVNRRACAEQCPPCSERLLQRGARLL